MEKREPLLNSTSGKTKRGGRERDGTSDTHTHTHTNVLTLVDPYCIYITKESRL